MYLIFLGNYISQPSSRQHEGSRIYVRTEKQGRRWGGHGALPVRPEPGHLQDVQDPAAGRADERLPAGHEQLLQQAEGAGATNKKASKVEILQHVIDYIWDLQVELDEPEKSRQSGGLPRTPLTTLNAELASISVEVNIVLSFGPLWVGGGDSPLFNFA